jgi:putative transposase
VLVVGTGASADAGTIAPEVLGRLTAEHRRRWEVWWADGKYHTHHLNGWWVESEAGSRIDLVGRPAGRVGFVKLPRRWVVERTFAWRGRYRRNSRDDEWHTHSSEAMIKISSIHRMLRHLRPDQAKEPIPFKYRG